ncbi:hypothetical protein PHISP_03245 [Aspergillus sp. HF37]|nr:hypothetical protein PHISP_03245 [Aspergillus sp. HF37]
MPAKRKAAELSVPDITENPAERKRLLNVLAQRRYRQRKSRHLQSLEAQAQKKNGPHEHTDKDDNTSSVPSFDVENEELLLDFGMTQILETGLSHDAPPSTAARAPNSEDAEEIDGGPNLDIINPDILSDLGMSANAQPAFPPELPFSNEHLLQTHCRSQAPSIPEIPPSGGLGLPRPFPFAAWSESGPSLPSTIAWVASSDQSKDRSTTSTSTADPISLASSLQMSESSTFTFPDDHVLQVPSLTLLNAAAAVAHRLNIIDKLWDMSAVSPFYAAPAPPQGKEAVGPTTDPSTLPLHLHPTPTQHLVRHHPLLDLLPWSGARDKLIQVFSLPVEMRPKTAQDPIGLTRLVYDMEDPGGEGIRVTGQNPFEAKGWEIGQLMFERWWWAFDAGVVDRSNHARRNRGENVLRLEME